MPHLIIGHTCEKSARIWVRGDDKSTACEVSLYPAGSLQPQRILLDADNDYTGTVSLEKLEPGIDYIVHAAFSPSEVLVRGRLCTHAQISWLRSQQLQLRPFQLQSFHRQRQSTSCRFWVRLPAFRWPGLL